MRIKRGRIWGTPKCMELLCNLSRDDTGFPVVNPDSIAQARIPVPAAAFGRGVQNGPERIEVGRTARILAGVGGGLSHFAGPEMTDRTVAAREHVIAGHIGIRGADVIAGVVARSVRIDLVLRPAARLLRLDQSRDRRARHEHERDALLDILQLGRPGAHERGTTRAWLFALRPE